MHVCIFCPLIQFPFLPPISVSPIGVFQIGGQKKHKCIILPRGGERGGEYAFDMAECHIKKGGVGMASCIHEHNVDVVLSSMMRASYIVERA